MVNTLLTVKQIFYGKIYYLIIYHLRARHKRYLIFYGFLNDGDIN